MTFTRFHDYARARRSGAIEQDASYRAYDLLWRQSAQRLTMALCAAGFMSGEVTMQLAECTQRLSEWGFDTTWRELRELLQEWYIWQRIVDGKLDRWKLRSKKGR